MPTRAIRQTVLWVAGIVAAVVILDALQAALWPFVAGMAIGYLLDPLADRLEAIGCPRGFAAGLIVLVFLFALITVLVVLVPVLLSQAVALISRLPAYLEQFREFAWPIVADLEGRLSPEMADRLGETLRSAAGDAFAWVGSIARSLLGSGLALVNLLSILVIMPLVAFYLVRDWDRIVAQIDSLIPLPWRDEVRTQAAEIDRRLSGFIRGQALVCLFLATWFSTGLSLVGLDFGLVVGIGAGVIAFIPYVSTVVGVTTALGLAFAQFDSWLPIAGVAAVFATGQVLQDSVLVPKLIGDRVGLHPAWVLFALMAGGTAFGFTGVLLAVPVAAALGVLIRFAIERYRNSHLFHGGFAAADDAAVTGGSAGGDEANQ